MELIIVRHALPEKIINTDPLRPADPPLDSVGLKQAELVATYLAEESIDALYCSPMRRAVETAAPIAKATGLAATICDGVAEYDRSSPEYIPIEELRATNHPNWLAMQRGEWAGTSDPAEFQRGVVDAIEGIIAAHPRQRVVVACHGGVINAYLAYVLKTPSSLGFFEPFYTSIHRIMAASTGQRSIVTVNEISHLRNTGLLGPR